VRAQGADARVLQAYMGHSRGDVLGLHYEQIAVEQMRAEIVPCCEEWWDKSGTSEETHQIQGALSATK
jgi:hypothetical protein